MEKKMLLSSITEGKKSFDKKLSDFLLENEIIEESLIGSIDDDCDFIKEEDLKFRVINPNEVENLTDDALNYLLELKGMNKISDDSFEEILTDVSGIFGTMDKECLKDLLNYRGVGEERIIN